MRPITQPPSSSHCKKCGGELRLKRTEVVDRELALESEILVCANCGREQSDTVRHDPKIPRVISPGLGD
jgi:uncharacterized protein with PIN domain